MREFYKIETIDFDDSKFAYSDVPDESNYADSGLSCPKCGAPIGELYWLEPRKVLSKPKYGDFVSGLRVLVSDNFKSAYEQSDLKGIEALIPVEVAKVRYMKKLLRYLLNTISL